MIGIDNKIELIVSLMNHEGGTMIESMKLDTGTAISLLPVSGNDMFEQREASMAWVHYYL